MKTYKFLADDDAGVFSRFSWPLPDEGPGPWVEADVALCRSGIHACRRADLPYWMTRRLYEIELDGEIVVEPMKVVAPRGRLLRRIIAWDDAAREEFSQMCIAEAGVLARHGGPRLEAWAPTPESSAAGPALMSFIAARLAEATGGVEAYVEERLRQSVWLAERLGLAD